jgi:hypothetical protein
MLAGGLATAWPSAHASAATCESVRVVTDLLTLPSPWRDALLELVLATAQDGLPWSCAGGSVALVLDAQGGALLTVTDRAGSRASRHVGGPDEVAPTGEALLASPVTESAPASVPAAHAEPAPAAGPAEPRAQVQVMIGPRVSGPGAMAWGSAFGRVQVPFGPWSAGFYARYELHLAGPSGPWSTFRTSAVSGGLSAGRRIFTAPFELRVALDPSIAVVIMESGSENVPHPEGAKPAFRIGTELQALFPIAGVFRGVVGLDGEFAPAGIPNGLNNIDQQNHPPQLPAVPVYTAGVLLGFEAAIR